MAHPHQMRPPCHMRKIWATIENCGSLDSATATPQEQTHPPNPSQSETEENDTRVSSGDRSGQNSTMEGGSRIGLEADAEEHGDTSGSVQGEGEGQQQPQPQPQPHQDNLLENSPSRRWLAFKKCCNVFLWAVLGLVVVASYYGLKSSFADPPWINDTPTPPRSLNKQRRDLNLELVLKQIIKPSSQHRVMHSLNKPGQQRLPDDFLATVSAFAAFCRPDTFTFAIFLSQDLSDAFQNQRSSLPSKQVRAVLLRAHELAERAAGAEAKADTAARRKLVDQDAIEIPPLDIAFENQTLYHHLISPTASSSPHSNKRKEKKEEEEEEEDTLYHQCEELADPGYAKGHLMDMKSILQELYMSPADDGPMEERWARELRDGFDEWFYERLLRVSSF